MPAARDRAGAVDAGGFAGRRTAAGVAAGGESSGRTRAGALAAKFGVEAAQQLAGRYPPDAPTVLGRREARVASSGSTGDRKSPEPSERRPVRRVPRRRREPRSRGRRAGAESVLAGLAEGLEWLAPAPSAATATTGSSPGRKTKSGQPILANDPHLQIEFPSVWYEMHLVAAGLDVAGVTIPGVPFVVLGHNARIAWGMTNTGADVQDLYLERVDVARQAVRCLAGAVAYRSEVSAVDIPVRGGRRRRPSRSGRRRTARSLRTPGLDWEAPPAWLTPAGRESEASSAPTSMRWDVLAATSRPASKRSTARATGSTFTAAVDPFAVPSQNIVYADVDGNIGYAMSGRLPVRSRRRRDDAARRRQRRRASGVGPSTRHRCPRVVQSAGGLHHLVQQRDRSRSGALITRDWAAPFRATRLERRAGQGQGLDLDAMAALQNDRKSLAADAGPGRVWPARSRKPSAAAVGFIGGASALLAATVRPGIAWSTSGRWWRSTRSFEDVLWRRTFERRDGRAALPRVLRMGRRRAPGRAVHDRSATGSRAGSTTSRTVDRRETRDDIFVLAAGDADEEMKAIGREANRRLGPRAWRAVRAPARQRGRSARLALQPRPGADDRRRHDGDAGQLEPAAPVRGVGASVVAAVVRGGRVGPVRA